MPKFIYSENHNNSCSNAKGNILPLIPNVGCLGNGHGLQCDTLNCNFLLKCTILNSEKNIYCKSIFHDEYDNINMCCESM